MRYISPTWGTIKLSPRVVRLQCPLSSYSSDSSISDDEKAHSDNPVQNNESDSDEDDDDYRIVKITDKSILTRLSDITNANSFPIVQASSISKPVVDDVQLAENIACEKKSDRIESESESQNFARKSLPVSFKIFSKIQPVNQNMNSVIEEAKPSSKANENKNKLVKLKDSGQPGTILRSIDNGKHWEMVKIPTKYKIVRAKLLEEDLASLLDEVGSVFISVDHGLTWNHDND